MTWEYEYDRERDETTVYWDGSEQFTIGGEITRWENGYPTGDAREEIGKHLQETDSPAREMMLFDLNYGFSKHDGEQS